MGVNFLRRSRSFVWLGGLRRDCVRGERGGSEGSVAGVLGEGVVVVFVVGGWFGDRIAGNSGVGWPAALASWMAFSWESMRW